MARNAGLDWQSQLAQLRGTVEEMEKRRAEEERLQLERSREGLVERLKKDTPASLNEESLNLRRECDRAARRFFPPHAIADVLGRLKDFRKRLQFYTDCKKDFKDLFPPDLSQVIGHCLRDVDKAKAGLERQLGQWREVEEALEHVSFRPRDEADGPALSQRAKEFSQRAHGMGLSIPNDFFASEGEGFHVVLIGEEVIGHVKYWDDKDVITFAIAPLENANFPKFVRGVLWKAYQGPLADKNQAKARVRLSMNKEVKFFTDLGFSRAETVSVNEWIFDRALD